MHDTTLCISQCLGSGYLNIEWTLSPTLIDHENSQESMESEDGSAQHRIYLSYPETRAALWDSRSLTEQLQRKNDDVHGKWLSSWTQGADMEGQDHAKYNT